VKWGSYNLDYLFKSFEAFMPNQQETNEILMADKEVEMSCCMYASSGF